MVISPSWPLTVFLWQSSDYVRNLPSTPPPFPPTTLFLLSGDSGESDSNPSSRGESWRLWAHLPGCGWFQSGLLTRFRPVLWEDICSGTSEKDLLVLTKVTPYVTTFGAAPGCRCEAWICCHPLETTMGKALAAKCSQNGEIWVIDGTTELLNWQTLKLV